MGKGTRNLMHPPYSILPSELHPYMTRLIMTLLVASAAFPVACQTAQPPQTAQPDPDGPVMTCSDYPAQASSSYVLPYRPGETYEVWGSTSHFTPGNGGVGVYAIDFVMPIGTPIVAAREGEVVAARDSFPDHNGVDLEENFVFIRHADSTVARYFHLTEDGAEVAVGDHVAQGQVIGRSGNTGQSGGPHLHFDVQSCGPNLPPGYNALPCGQTVPVVFRNTEPHPCGVTARHTYTARP